MPKWATILTVVFSGIVAVISIATFLKSFNFVTKDDLIQTEQRLERKIDDINKRIDRHLEHHAEIVVSTKD